MRHGITLRVVMLSLVALSIAACGGGEGESSGTTSPGQGGAGGGGQGGAGAAGGGGQGGSGGGQGGAGGVMNADIPGGGTVLFEETFEDGDFAARGWYDGAEGALSTAEHAPGSATSFECAFAPGGTACAQGKPARHPVTPTNSVYLRFWLKFSDDWVGSGKPYHPHMFHFLTNEDDKWVGPSHTYLTTYTEVVQGKAFLGLQDSKNVDLGCILRNNGTFVGCNGSFDDYMFTEDRSACACNGLAGLVEGRDCFANGDGTWYSSRHWTADGAFTDAAGPNAKNTWHLVEVYFELNTIENGIGLPNGKIRWVQDGKTLIESDEILFRTGAHPDMQFNQFAMLPYIGDGSPVDQRFWVDDLMVATARP
ncbi:hypothetical protein [Polyangium spumosum]|uniref:hypothetical protein n=1 Tax=Polyangium spumosum TaxID=889282 RepID=UPI00197F2613|nr:hypothetical protein [Polyangium spumosum]